MKAPISQVQLVMYIKGCISDGTIKIAPKPDRPMVRKIRSIRIRGIEGDFGFEEALLNPEVVKCRCDEKFKRWFFGMEISHKPDQFVDILSLSKPLSDLGIFGTINGEIELDPYALIYLLAKRDTPLLEPQRHLPSYSRLPYLCYLKCRADVLRSVSFKWDDDVAGWDIRADEPDDLPRRLKSRLIVHSN
jgi:hypothetical protein